MSAMTITTSAATAVRESAAAVFHAGHGSVASAVGGPRAADWDLLSALTNAEKYGRLLGGAVITLVGLILVIVAIVFLAKKFLAGQQSQSAGWGKIIVMGIIGGALMAGGIVWVIDIAQGGKATIDDLGGGMILAKSALALLG